MSHSAIPIDPDRTAQEWMVHARADVESAMAEAIFKHGIPTTDPVRGAANLAEEVGEVATEALEATRPNKEVVTYPIGYHYERMIRELNQVAGYAILLRVSMEGELRRLRKEKK